MISKAISDPPKKKRDSANKWYITIIESPQQIHLLYGHVFVD